MHVVGVFSGRDYKKDIENMETEFMISDLAILEKKIPQLEKELQAKPSNEKSMQKNVLTKCKTALDNNKPIRTLEFNASELKLISGYQFLSQKPIFVVANLDEEQISADVPEEIASYCKDKNYCSISMCGKVEAEIQDLDEAEKKKFASEMGISELAAEKVVRIARDEAGLMTFFTGSFDGDETRAWAVPRGATALEAAGKIHSDIQKGFIRAEVVGYDDFIQCGSFNEAKNKGVFRLEGKDYIVKDGDIITFRFNV